LGLVKWEQEHKMTIEGRPDKLPTWATDNGAIITEPTDGKKATGWLSPEKPTDGGFNWWQNLTYKWVNYLDQLVFPIVEGYMSEVNKLMGSLKVKNKKLYWNVKFSLAESLGLLAFINTTGTNGIALSNATGSNLFGITYPNNFDAPTAVTASTNLLSIRGRGWDGTALSLSGGACRLTYQASANWSSTSHPGNIILYTTASGTTTQGNAYRYNFDKTTTRYGSAGLNANNSYNSGSNSLAWANIYSVNVLNVTSDERKKKEIQSFDLGLDFIKKLDEFNAIASWKWDFPAIEDEFTEEEILNEATGETETYLVQTQYANNEQYTRRHNGIIAQRALEAMNDLEISTKDFPLISIENYQEGQELDPYAEDLGTLTARYEALIPVLLNAVLELNQRLENLEGV
jgi:hypothetical protein